MPTVDKRPEGYTTADADIDARNYHANEDRRVRVEQDDKDRVARSEQARWDRVAQASVALFSALVAIATAYCAAWYGIKKLDSSSQHFAIVSAKEQDGQDAVLRLNTTTGQTWTLIKGVNGPAWKPLPQ